MDVAMVRWPAEEDRRAGLAASHAPRLLVLEAQVTPPEPADCLEDWVRASAPDEELRARLAALTRRAFAHVAVVPLLDDDGVLRMGSSWVSLPPVESRLATALLERFGAVVSRDSLGRAGWPTGPPGRNALDVHMLRLRRRVAPVALAIRTVRSRGYLLERSGSGQVHAGQA
ncbi:MAG TPA: helix-turn-helix domain-containing protein [Acidimicrobiales bacterium]|nr:helix-turn-helix domain-containing protein [Acidimicrobiales bacterium]